MSASCYFDPTKGQVPDITPSGTPSERSLPSIPDLFGSCFVLAVIIVSIVIMYCLCQKKGTNILVVGMNEPTTQTERSQMEEMKSNSHLSLKYSLYVSTIALAVILLLIPSWREEFSDSVWVIVYFLALFSFLLLSLNYSHNSDLNHGMRSS
jgi:Ca2+/Na+ antiporter